MVGRGTCGAASWQSQVKVLLVVLGSWHTKSLSASMHLLCFLDNLSAALELLGFIDPIGADDGSSKSTTAMALEEEGDCLVTVTSLGRISVISCRSIEAGNNLEECTLVSTQVGGSILHLLLLHVLSACCS